MFLVCEVQQSSNLPSVCVRVCVLLCMLLGHTTLICCHICVSWLLRDMAGQTLHVHLSPCILVHVTGEAMAPKGMWQRSHIQGATTHRTPRGWNIQYWTTHTHVDTDMLCTEAHWGLVACVCNHGPLLPWLFTRQPPCLPPDPSGFPNKLC